MLPEDLAEFYRKLMASEARHFAEYLGLAQRYCTVGVGSRLEELLEVEADLVRQTDDDFRFHSGPLVESIQAAVR